MSKLEHITPAEVRKWEYLFSDYLGGGHVVATHSATMSLVALGYALGLRDKEVITSPLTYPGAISALYAVGAKVVWSDIAEEALNISANSIAQKISADTAAVLSTDYLGFPCQLDILKKVCTSKNVLLIHDAAASIGAQYKGRFSGWYADYTVFSFGRGKLVSGDGGGAIWTKGRQNWKRLMQIIAHPDDQQLHFSGLNPFVLNIRMHPANALLLLHTWQMQIEELRIHMHDCSDDNQLNKSNTPNYYHKHIAPDFYAPTPGPGVHVPVETKDSRGLSVIEACPNVIKSFTTKAHTSS